MLRRLRITEYDFFHKTTVLADTTNTDNNLFKYADDTTLLVPEHSAVDIVTEFHHIQAWATANKLCICL